MENIRPSVIIWFQMKVEFIEKLFKEFPVNLKLNDELVRVLGEFVVYIDFRTLKKQEASKFGFAFDANYDKFVALYVLKSLF